MIALTRTESDAINEADSRSERERKEVNKHLEQGFVHKGYLRKNGSSIPDYLIPT